MESFWTEFLEKSKRVLLLQGPIGPFFTHLQDYLADKQDKIVFKLAKFSSLIRLQVFAMYLPVIHGSIVATKLH